MHPGGTVAKGFSLGVIGTVIALEIFHAGPEFRGGVFGQIMGQTLPIQTKAETIFPNQCPVMIDCFQMAPKIHVLHLYFVDGTSIALPQQKNEEKMQRFFREKNENRWKRKSTENRKIRGVFLKNPLTNPMKRI
jgi:hypothetical protein